MVENIRINSNIDKNIKISDKVCKKLSNIIIKILLKW